MKAASNRILLLFMIFVNLCTNKLLCYHSLAAKTTFLVNVTHLNVIIPWSRLLLAGKISISTNNLGKKENNRYRPLKRKEKKHLYSTRTLIKKQ